MADYRQDNRDRPHDSSIFATNDRTDRWREDYRRWSSSGSQHGPQSGRAPDYRGNQGRPSSDDRGFFERAGDEVRSWFGDEEAERRREADARRYEQEHGMGGHYRGGGHEDQWTGGTADRQYTRDPMGSSHGNAGGYGQNRPQGGYGSSHGDRSRSGGYGRTDHGQSAYGQRAGQSPQSFGGRQQGDHHGQGPRGQSYGQAPSQASGFGQSGAQRGGGSAHSTAAHDEAYRRWREQQIQALDREYQEYCQHRQHQFEQDFSSFRQSRQSVTSGGPTMSHGGAPRGSTEIASSSGATQGLGTQMSGESAGRNAAATTTGGGTASATMASVGSTGMAAETGNRLTATGAQSGRAPSKSGKSRS